MDRRNFLQSAGMLLAVVVALPQIGWSRSRQAFKTTSFTAAMADLFPGQVPIVSDKIKLKVPAIAENGAVVPVTVSTTLADVTNISVLVNENPTPLTASFDLQPEAIPTISTRLKMGKTSMVTALVAAGGQLYSIEHEVKVTIGGCGG